MSNLLSPFALRGVTLKNRLVVSPMCQYSAQHGLANDWHFAHLARFALGGFGAILAEATGVVPEGRITYGCLGLWDDVQIAPLARINAFVKSQGSVPGIQLGHAGRRASTPLWWRGTFNETEAEKPLVGFEHWQPVAPSALIHEEGSDYQVPRELTLAEVQSLPEQFAAATRRALTAGFELIEIHAAHGYLLNQFLSPIANRRTDGYGGSLANRMRLLLEVVEAMRAVWPNELPLILRLSVQDALQGGWTVQDSLILAPLLIERGIDLIDCSSTGFSGADFRPGPCFQVHLARALREAGIPTMAVGLIATAEEAEAVVASGSADLVAMGRTALDDPNFPQHAARSLAEADIYDRYPKQVGFTLRMRDAALSQTAR